MSGTGLQTKKRKTSETEELGERSLKGTGGQPVRVEWSVGERENRERDPFSSKILVFYKKLTI
ncbi:hypothetical protein CCACVL1_06333 [Corchorus capsularis]|uniref:Uncharacterized protein n=1 Tax=Corchorus capsularis TaxID=210143 RepID=A0A1R3JG64_COCAP|nr:hypothetical protein CCACVL1_06333 [Corchorus capsularis]